MVSPIYEWDEIEHVFRDLVVCPIIYLHECTQATTKMKVVLTHKCLGRKYLGHSSQGPYTLDDDSLVITVMTGSGNRLNPVVGRRYHASLLCRMQGLRPVLSRGIFMTGQPTPLNVVPPRNKAMAY